MTLVDTHSHIYSSEFEGDQAAMIARSLEADVLKIIMPAIDASTHEQMLAAEQQYPGSCIAMMGLHPCSVKANYQEELDIIRGWLERRRFIAIGEIGLDFYWDTSFTVQQTDAFRKQVSWALEYDYPISIHSRNATDECIAIVREMQDGRLKGVFHCFSGTAEQATAITELGFYLGIGGVLTFKNSGLDKAIQGVDLRHLVLETDAPYLAPVPYRGKRNEPAYIPYIVEKLATVLGRPVEEIAAATTENAQNLFGLKAV